MNRSLYLLAPLAIVFVSLAQAEEDKEPRPIRLYDGFEADRALLRKTVVFNAATTPVRAAVLSVRPWWPASCARGATRRWPASCPHPAWRA